ncbi:hypothetical protein [Saccharothrix obliqua]|uniref:hypothetical protein n=1 Tax=Saccharothrix obliqua TaxID=2861747 RepID=UPI001C5E1DD0|nr:hypothetical protein [Saccharothrix obliqua]MBW4720782.1 hypothetical protein [Saccharothrix obliqua]
MCVLAACTASPPPPTTVTVTAPVTTTTPPTTASTPAIVASGYAAVCQGRGFPDVPAYSGPGPHSIAISVRAAKGYPTGIEDDLDSDVTELPAEWKSAGNTTLQLVACVTVLDAVEVRECEYRVIGSTTGTSLFTNRLFNRVLRVEVRSTNTGKPVAEAVELTTSTTTCAATAKQPQSATGPSPHQYGKLTDAERDGLLRDLVTATV